MPQDQDRRHPSQAAVDAETARRIEQQLQAIEVAEDAHVLFACESGSRAWGFASTDSDYDVRFVYVRRADWYLSIDVATRRDVIERPIDADLDMSGWDLPKTLQLYRRSNPPLFEWLGSPIVYRDIHGLAAGLRSMGADFYLPKAAAYHYARMCRNNWRTYLQRPRIALKKYLYALRPLMAVLWIERGLGIVPTEFSALVAAVVDDATVKNAIGDLTTHKAAGTEAADGEPIAPLHDFLSDHMGRLEAIASELAPEPRGSTERLNALFRSCLRAAWGEGC